MIFRMQSSFTNSFLRSVPKNEAVRELSVLFGALKTLGQRLAELQHIKMQKDVILSDVF